MIQEQTIADLIDSRPDLQALLQELVGQGFLLPGIFDPRAYLRDEDQILSAWKAEKSRLNAIALGVSLHNDLYCELVNQVLAGEDPETSAELRRSIERWTAAIAKRFPDHEEMEANCSLLGQYLEFMNRKSQGF